MHGNLSRIPPPYVARRDAEKRWVGAVLGWARVGSRRGNKSGKNESIGGVFQDAALEAPEGGGPR